MAVTKSFLSLGVREWVSGWVREREGRREGRTEAARGRDGRTNGGREGGSFCNTTVCLNCPEPVQEVGAQAHFCNKRLFKAFTHRPTDHHNMLGVCVCERTNVQHGKGKPVHACWWQSETDYFATNDSISTACDSKLSHAMAQPV